MKNKRPCLKIFNWRLNYPFIILQEANSKCIRALAPAFDGVEDMINRYNFESKQEIDLLHFWDLVQA